MRYLEKFKALILVVIIVSFITPAFAAPRAKTTQEIKIVADPLLDNIIEGFKFDKYTIYCRDLDAELKVAGSRTKFFKVSRHIKTSLGNYLYREYMGSLLKGDMIVVLWKAKYDKTKNDVLIKLVIKKQGRHYVVTGLWLQ
ncbi:MAG: hypothetical protein KAS13_00305 [Candidatus Omnitrophica bacterium]|nr:hypothetical protein [Candidatus Omnitrophota bacterium]